MTTKELEPPRKVSRGNSALKGRGNLANGIDYDDPAPNRSQRDESDAQPGKAIILKC